MTKPNNYIFYNSLLFSEVKHFGLKMPKEMINFTLDRKGNEPWGFVIVGGKDQVGIDIDDFFLLILILILMT